MKKILFFGIIVFLLFGCSKEQKLPNQKFKTIKVKTEKIQLKNVPYFVNVDGFVSCNKIAYISPKIDGYIEKIFVKVGDKVKKGEIIAKIKNKEIKDKLTSLKYKLKALKFQKKQAEILIKIYEKSIVQAKANFILAKKNFLRFKKLLKTDSVTPQEFDRMKTKYINAKMELNKSKNFLEINKLKLKQIETEIKSVKSSLDEIRVIADYRFVKAPFNGVVLEKYLDEGNLVKPGIKILKIGSIKKIAYFSIPLKYKNFKKIFINNRSVNIIEVSPDIKRNTSQFTIKTSLPRNNYENGQYLQAKLFIGYKKELLLNKNYLKKYNDLYYTFICKNGFIIKTILTGKFQNKNNFIVQTGLEPGDNVIIYPNRDFSENLECKIEKNSNAK